MRTSFVFLLIGAVTLTVVGGSSLHRRQRRQSWGFPEEASTTERFPSRPPTTTRASSNAATTSATPTAQPTGPTSTQPAGVVFQVKDCPCQAPPQYNPVCGSDGNTYVNRQKLECTRRCGFNVQESRMGAC